MAGGEAGPASPGATWLPGPYPDKSREKGVFPREKGVISEAGCREGGIESAEVRRLDIQSLVFALVTLALFAMLIMAVALP
jgi:hypothetical protein